MKLRQNRMPLGRPSTPGRMLAPVVVKPETVSNMASTGFGMQDVYKRQVSDLSSSIEALLTNTISASFPASVTPFATASAIAAVLPDCDQ